MFTRLQKPIAPVWKAPVMDRKPAPELSTQSRSLYSVLQLQKNAGFSERGQMNPPRQTQSLFSPSQLVKEKETDFRGQILAFRSSNVIQMAYKKTEEGDDGVYLDMDDHNRPVIKIGGYSAIADVLDNLTEQFGLKSTQSRFVYPKDGDWTYVETALTEAGHQEKLIGLSQAVLMNFVEGKDLHMDSVFRNTLSDYVEDSPAYERHETMLKDLGKLLVMDLLTRNNDRFLLEIDGLKNANELEDENAWGGNQGNLRIDSEGHITAIDNQFTFADNEQVYINLIADYLMNPEKKKELAKKALVFMDYNGKDDQEDIEVIIQGINEGLGMLPHINIE